MPMTPPLGMQMPPEMLMSIVSDPRSPPQQRAAAVAALQAAGVGGGPLPPGAPQGMPQQQMPPTQPPEAPGLAEIRAGAAAADATAGDEREPSMGPETMRRMAAGGRVQRLAGGGGVMSEDPDAMDIDITAGDDGTGGLASMDPRLTAMIRQMMSADEAPLTREDKGFALAKAGFGMAASGATTLGQGIGQGAVYGLAGLEEAKKARAMQRMKQAALIQSGMLRSDQLKLSEQAMKDRAAAAHQASVDRQDAIKQREEDSKRDDIRQREATKGSQAIQAALAAAAAERAAAAAAAAPTGVVPASAEQAKSVGIPFEGISNPYEKVSKKTAEQMYASNTKIFENRKTKNALVEGKNREMEGDVDRFYELNQKGITGPSLAIPGVGQTKTFLDPDLQEMDSITNRLAPNMRQLLPGAASDADVKMFKGAGPQKIVDKQVNNNRIMALKAAIRNQDDKEQFMSDFFEVHHHLEGADKAWRQYLNANPIFDHTKGIAPYTLNNGRKTYQEYFGGDKPAEAVLSSGDAPPPRVPGPSGAPGLTKITVRKGTEILSIDPSDVSAAKADGYEVMP